MSLSFVPLRAMLTRTLPTINRSSTCSSHTISSVLSRQYHAQTSPLFFERLLDDDSPLQMTIDTLRRAGWSLASVPAGESRLSASKRFDVPNDFRYRDHARRRELLDVFLDKSEEVVVESIRTNQHAVRVDLSLSFAALQKLVSMDKKSSVIESSFFREDTETDLDDTFLAGIPA